VEELVANIRRDIWLSCEPHTISRVLFEFLGYTGHGHLPYKDHCFRPNNFNNLD
jgi:hypothetical protein